MNKENFYIVSWDERHQITLKAKSEDDAKNKVSSGDYKEEDEASEMNGSLEAQEIDLTN